MKKLTFALFLIFSFINVYALDINSESYILYNLEDNTIIMDNNAYEKDYIASLTKIVTAIVAIENIDNLNERITVTSEDLEGLEAANASVANFKLGQSVTYNDLLYGLMLESGADAANTLARGISGSTNEFIKLMNDLVVKLELKNTNFTNTTGLYDENHYSSAYDISQLLLYALENDTFYKLFTSKTYLTSDKNITFSPTYTLLGSYHNIDTSLIAGGKTGYVSEAGLCFASISRNTDIPYLLITLGANHLTGKAYQLIDAVNIYEYVDENYEYKTIYEENEILYFLDTTNSTVNQYNILAPTTFKYLMHKEENPNSVTYNYHGINIIDPTDDINDLGTIEVVYNDKVINSFNVTYNNSLDISLIGNLKTYSVHIVLGVISLITILIIIKKLRKN